MTKNHHLLDDGHGVCANNDPARPPTDAPRPVIDIDEPEEGIFGVGDRSIDFGVRDAQRRYTEHLDARRAEMANRPKPKHGG